MCEWVGGEMSFLEPSTVVHQHHASVERSADLGFEVSGRIMQQLALRLVPQQKVATWASAIIAHDHAIGLGDAGYPDLVMAANQGDAPARLVLSLGGPVGAFDLGRLAGRVLLPQENFFAAGPGVKMRPYSHVRALASASRPDGLMLMLAEGDGWMFSGGQGEVSEVVLGAGETLTVRGSAIAALSATLVVDGVVGAGQGAPQACAMAALRGPGRVWLQSCGEQADANAVQEAYMRLNQNRPAGLPGR